VIPTLEGASNVNLQLLFLPDKLELLSTGLNVLSNNYQYYHSLISAISL